MTLYQSLCGYGTEFSRLFQTSDASEGSGRGIKGPHAFPMGRCPSLPIVRILRRMDETQVG
jgi:hypothetical protein